MNLPSVWPGDLNYPESEVKAGDTEFFVQRLGSACNYLIDAFPPLNTRISNVATITTRITPISFHAHVPFGDTVIATGPVGTIFRVAMFNWSGLANPWIVPNGSNSVYYGFIQFANTNAPPQLHIHVNIAGGIQVDLEGYMYSE